MTQIAADALGLPVARVQFELGDSKMPPAPVEGGSMTVASVGSAVHEAALAARDKVLMLASGDDALAAAQADGGPGGRGGRPAVPQGRAGSRRDLRGHPQAPPQGVGRGDAGVEAGRRAEEVFDARLRGASSSRCGWTPTWERCGWPASSAASPPAASSIRRRPHSQAIGGIVGGIGMAPAGGDDLGPAQRAASSTPTWPTTTCR